MESSKQKTYIQVLVLTIVTGALMWRSTPILQAKSRPDFLTFPSDSEKTLLKLRYPIRDQRSYEYRLPKGAFNLADPPNIRSKVSLDSGKYEYQYSSKIGKLDYRTPPSVLMKDRLRQESNSLNRDYFKQRAQANNFVRGNSVIPPLVMQSKVFDKIFGSGVIDIRPRGTAELIFAGNFNVVRNPAFSLRQQRTGQFDFRQKIQLNVAGSVGDKLKVNMNYDTEATFEFENQLKLNYAGKEDDIIKKIELGNVSLPLNSSLIQGSQSLFGIKTAMQFGKLTVTTILSQQRGKTTETEIQGGSQTTKFDISCDNYDMNRHYFLSQYFYQNYDKALSRIPIISSPVVITRIEVWITNRSGSFDQSRAVIGFTDLGENKTVANNYWIKNNAVSVGNESNGLWGYLNGNGNSYLVDAGSANAKTRDELRSLYGVENQLLADYASTNIEPISEYQIINYARQLAPTEFSFNRNLGYISLNQALSNDDVLCVAYEGTVGGIPFKVGEFGQDVPVNATSPNVLHLKMLKGPSMRPDLVTWKLMMKNVYALNSFNLSKTDFKFNIIYADDPSGADLNYIPVQNEPLLTGKPLLTVLNLDNTNSQMEAAPDGVFDFIEGVTVNTQTGRIFLPSVEPFGRYLRKKFLNDTLKADYYAFTALYDSTRFAASQLSQYDKFFLRGSYTGANNSEIPLSSTNVPKGSVRVTANGAPLTEGVDYIVDYNLGRVKIVNTQLLNSSAIIRVSSESNNMFQVQQKSLIGSRFEYQHNTNTMLGGTLLYLTERPLTPKVNIGEEPVANLMIGLDGSIKKESRFLTKMVDKLPFIETKEPSMVTFTGEYAELIPGVQSALAQNGTAYLDDFEAAEVPFDLRMGYNWVLASTPHGQPDLFPEGNSVNSLENGYRRANLAWYTIASTFYRGDAYTPASIKSDPNSISYHRMREVLQTEIFQSKQIQQGMPSTLPTFDLSFYPKERGPYNFNVNDLNPDGTLRNPHLNWGGIMRKIDQNDFEQANIDYIEIWMMDPYADFPTSSNKGQLYINLGNISEDVLRDNRRMAENGLPRDGSAAQATMADTTVWGRVPRQPVITYSFDADNNVRKFQDIGFDGLNDDSERDFYKVAYLDKIANNPALGINSEAYKNAVADPSNDNYHYYLGSDYDSKNMDVLSRYKRYNMSQGNSPTVDQSPESYPTAATNSPDNEDLNKDFTLNTVEEYFQYKIDISKEGLQIGKNYVVDTVMVPASAKFLNNNTAAPEVWYQLKIPVHEFQSKVGSISDFKSIRFIRVFMRGFEDSITLRMASMQLVRADWRKYLNNLRVGGEDQPLDPTDNTQFVVSTVNIEKNSIRNPPYMVPPGIQREVDFSSPTPIQQNEQALSVKVCNLADGDARAVFKNTTVDFRRYGKLRMFLHADGDHIKNNELTAFIRFGTDLVNNYYEYEIPLKVTASNASTPRDIWPSENEITLTLEDLVDTKIMRTNANWPFTRAYVRQVGDAKFTVVGLPDFSQVKVVMLGVRNPKRQVGSLTDDGLPKCAEVWFNELRMTDFSRRGGRAANGRLIMKLADFGNVQLSGSYSSVGWGGIDKKITERSLNDNYQYDLQSTFELGKVFPKKTGISVPFFFSYGNTLIRPYYNPLNPDTRLQKEIDNTTNQERKDQISHASDDFTARRSINFTNVRKGRVGTKRAYPWDIENFSFTYIFNETYKRNQTLAYSILQNYRGVLTYNYTFTNKPFEPFSKKIKSKYLNLIKDFNFNYMPSAIGFRNEIDRRYGELLNRSNDNPNTIIPTLFDKNFTMRRYYEFRWDITKGLKFDYTSTADTRVDEPIGKIDNTTPEKKDTMMKNFWNGGRITKFDQTMHLNYNVPINKIPFLEFINQSSYNYTANYNWTQSPPIAPTLGNTIQNSRQQQINLGMNFSMLYNKFKILRSLNAPAPSRGNTEEKAPVKKGAKPEKGKKQEKESTGATQLPIAAKMVLKVLTGIKNVTGSYSINEGTLLPGFKPKPKYFGEDPTLNAPGIDFILGSQSSDFRYQAAKNGWMSTDSSIVNPYAQTYSETLNGSLTYEPLEDFRVSLTVTKTYSKTLNSFFRYDLDSGVFKDFGPVMENGSFSISYNTIASAFSPTGSDNITEVFHTFEKNRMIIANRIASDKGITQRDSAYFPVGYGAYSQDVLIPAFLAAYTGKSAENVSLSAFPSIPLPNWKISYNGLSKIKALKDIASNISISHAYTSTYAVGNFQTVADTSRNLAASSDFKPHYVIRNFSISEKFGPLIGVDVTLKKGLTAGLKYNKDRMLNFAMTNRQLSEQHSQEIVFNIGYRTQKLTLPFRVNGRRVVLNNDVNFRFDFGIRDNVTHIAYLDRPSSDPVTGQKIISIKPTIDYMINDKLMLRLFYDRKQTNPYTSNSFPTVITSGGFSLRYTMQ